MRHPIFGALLLAGSVWAAVPEEGILPGNRLVNGDFERGAEGFSPSLREGAKGSVVTTEGFESKSMLSFDVPVALRDSDNFFSQTVEAPPAPACRSYRITFWLRHKAMSDFEQGGAGVRAVFLDAEGRELGGASELFRRNTKLNEWETIDRIRDGWWDNWEFSFTLPENAARFRVECGLFRAAGCADIDRVIVSRLPTVEQMLAETAPAELLLTDEVTKPALGELHFCVNADWRFPGIFRGTLPESDPRSLRGEFAAALRKAGVRVIRFPGGMPTHQYFISGEKQYREFMKSPFARGNGNPYGYPKIENVIDFCRAYGFELLFETNTQYFTDAEGRVRPITANRDKAKCPEAFEKERVEEAAAELDRFLSSLPPGAIRYWEIGNEEFALMGLKEYARVAATFSRVIRKHRPDATILVTGNSWTADLCRELDALGAIAGVTALTAHYPWGDHWRPLPGGERDLRRFVCGRSNWAVNTAAHMKMIRDAGYPNLKMSGSETSVFKFHTWNSFHVIPTPAHGLLFAANWIEALKIPDQTSLAFHDMESPYFGMILIDQYWSAAQRGFRFIKPDGSIPAADRPERILRNRALVLPSGEAMGILSRHTGMDVLKTELSAARPEQCALLSAFATRAPNRVLITLVNRGEKPRKLTLRMPESGARSIAGCGISYDSLEGIAPEPHRFELRPELRDGRAALTLRPLSITQLEIAL